MRFVDYNFAWNNAKEQENIKKHKISFIEAQEVFTDPEALFFEDAKHSGQEDRCYAVGKTYGDEVITVRYTVRHQTIRIFGAAKWRKWRRIYEKRKNTGSLQNEES